MTSVIPAHLYRSQYWRSLLHLFTNHAKLQQVFTTKYFDLERENIRVAALKKDTAAWSQSEKFMLCLALHCYNDSNKINLGDMDYLDSHNANLALEALHLRYGGAMR